MLRDATCLSVHDRGLAVHADGADQVEKAGLAVVNVTNAADDRLSVFTALRGFLFRAGDSASSDIPSPRLFVDPALAVLGPFHDAFREPEGQFCRGVFAVGTVNHVVPMSMP